MNVAFFSNGKREIRLGRLSKVNKRGGKRDWWSWCINGVNVEFPPLALRNQKRFLCRMAELFTAVPPLLRKANWRALLKTAQTWEVKMEPTTTREEITTDVRDVFAARILPEFSDTELREAALNLAADAQTMIFMLDARQKLGGPLMKAQAEAYIAASRDRDDALAILGIRKNPYAPSEN